MGILAPNWEFLSTQEQANLITADFEVEVVDGDPMEGDKYAVLTYPNGVEPADLVDILTDMRELDDDLRTRKLTPNKALLVSPNL